MRRKSFFRLGTAWSLIIILNLPIIIVGLITIGVLFRNVSRDITNLNLDTTTYIGQISDNIIEQVISSSYLLENSNVYPDIYNFIAQKTDQISSLDYYGLRKSINDLFRNNSNLPICAIAVYSNLNQTAITTSSVLSLQGLYDMYLSGSGESFESINDKLRSASAQAFFIPSTAVTNSDANIVTDTLVLCRKIYPYSKNSGFFFAFIDMSDFMAPINEISAGDSMHFAICANDNTILFQDNDFDYSEASERSSASRNGIVKLKDRAVIYQTSDTANIKYLYAFEGNNLSGNIPEIVRVFVLLEILAVAFSLFFGGRRATILDKSVASLSQSNIMLSKNLKENRTYLREQIVTNIINEKNTETPDELEGKYGIVFRYPLYRVMVLHFTEDMGSPSATDKTAEMSDVICEVLEQHRIGCCFSNFTEPEYCAILNYEDEEMLHSNIFRLLGEILPLYGYDAYVYIGIGKKTDELKNMRSSYEDATLAAYYGMENKIPITYFDDIQDTGSAGIYYPYEIERQLYDSIQNGRTDEVSSILEKIREINFITRKPPYYLLQKLTSLMLVVIYRLIDELYADDKESHTKYTRACRNIIRADDPSESYRFLSEIALSISSDFECSTSNQEFKDKIISFIGKNYTNPDLSLAMLAAHIDISYHHLSHVFTDYMGETFISYLTKCRLKHSKELLLQCSEKIDTIAKMSGFSGSNTFIKTFKKYYGITPGQYRADHSTEV